MRKTIIMGLGLALSLAGAAAAQQPGQDAPRRPDAGERAKRGREVGPGGFLLRGITLTDAQKTELQTLHRSQQSGMEARREQMQKTREEARAARQRGDTAAARDIMQRSRQQMEQTRDAHVAAIRNILTAEQRVQFDRNVADFKARQEERGKHFGPRGERGKGRRMGGGRGR